jgi:hypothetical protein
VGGLGESTPDTGDTMTTTDASTSTSTPQRKTRKITLTDARPVQIYEDEWPVIAQGDYDEHDGQVRAQANRVTEVRVRVREHADGRRIVYGVYSYSSNWQTERSVDARAGYLLGAEDDVIAAIRRVQADLEARDAEHVREAADDCIADLPAERI